MLEMFSLKCGSSYSFYFHYQLNIYRNVPKFSDSQVWANSEDPDQTAPEQSDQGLHCLQFPVHLLDALF